MQREIYKWLSPNLQKEMEIAVYGHYGYALLMFPTATSDYLEYERCDLIESIRNYISNGTLKAFSVNSVNNESWLNKNISPADKAVRHQQYNKYIIEEVIPFIYAICGGSVPVVLTGASLGAYHSANTFFRKPELFNGVIAMSGIYDLKVYTNGYCDDNIYYNSPVDYLPNLTDESILSDMRNKNIIISSGQGAYEDPQASTDLSDILHSKNIPHWLDLWGADMDHDWPTWRRMLPYFLESLNI
ncbi:MAG: alpha/beta hydrolase-fold protein [Ignavibacteriaceae bacterium]